MQPSELFLQILVDNQAPATLLAEHGYSIWLEADGQKILLDAGQKVLLENASRLDCRPADLDSLVLSHGHYDHSGGIAELLAASSRLRVYTHPAAFLPRYKVTAEGSTSIRVTSANLTALNSLPKERLQLVRQPLWLSERVGITGEIPRRHPIETPGGPFFLDPAGGHADTIEDDMAIWVKTSHGLVVAVGCCHAGIINTLEWIREVSGEERVHAIIGGLHLLNAGPERLAWTVARLQELAVGSLVLCHCTGEAAGRTLAEHFPCRFGQAGMHLHY